MNALTHKLNEITTEKLREFSEGEIKEIAKTLKDAELSKIGANPLSIEELTQVQERVIFISELEHYLLSIRNSKPKQK